MGDIMKKMNKKSKQRILAGVALIVVVILIASAVFVYYEYIEKDEVKEPEIVPIDDQISPLENQAFIIEVKRIRHRGVYDALLTFGRSWRQPPSFYFVVDLDGLE